VSPSGIIPLKITWYFGKGTEDYIDRDSRDSSPKYIYKNPGTYDGYVEMDIGDGKTTIRRDFQVIVLPFPP
jgi:hypothetical protein